LKGVEFLESAVAELNSSTHPLSTPPLLKIVSNAFGEELEKVWEWCDVLVLPTLSETFGLVVAEALERGKRVITTDGAPVWGEGLDVRGQGSGVSVGYGGRLLYLNGYRDGSDEKRVELLKKAILFLAAKNAKDA
jgi:glycosyltransferase involved in cell wall biosynthesis